MTLYLHIGRGKSGSSTIQSLAKNHAEFMQKAGFSCPLTVNGLSNHGRLASALSAVDSDRPTIKKFRKDLARPSSPNIFLSAEAFHNMTDEGLARLKWLTRRQQVRILFYVRDYPSWIRSMYAQSTKKNSNLEDFDSFFKAGWKNLSVVTRLEKWAGVFGWESIRIRPLDATVLVGGDLISDLLHELGVNDPAPEVLPENQSPHWMTLEIMRALGIAATRSEIGSINSRSIRLIRRLIEDCMDPGRPRRTQYLNRAQWREAADLYQGDMEILGRHVGMTFPVSWREPQEREFLPDLNAVPRDVRDTIRNRMDDARFSARIDPSVSAVLGELLSR
ncbi:hypothetical protein BH10PSE6_BH10PSE6_26230 [soil metagenome]